MKPEQYPTSPKNLWNIFYDFTQIPRPSKHEEKIREYLLATANDHKLESFVDKVGNVLIKVPGKNGKENDSAVLIQNHIDMVTDAIIGKSIDFTKDPISTYVSGEWLKADGTTLGADNGIGCAAALAVIFEEDIAHPPLELLFTVDEETGLNGALGLDVTNIKAKKMLNLDTEEWGSLYIGCAGGIDYEFTRDFELVSKNDDYVSFKLQVEGLVGGHSGCDIHEQGGNAIILLAQALNELNSKLNIQVSEIRGGKAHNIIPRDAFAHIMFASKDLSAVKESIEKIKSSWKSFLPVADKEFALKLEKIELDPKVVSVTDLNSMIDFLLLFPHGAHSYDLNAREIVSMSNNLARVLFVRGKFYTQTSVRFFDREEARPLERKLNILANIYKMQINSESEYPSWKPVLENEVLELVKSCYKDLNNSEPEVTAIHAGLECGILRDKIGPLDVVSFGPTILGAHSPDERVHIPSVEKFWELFKLVLTKI